MRSSQYAFETMEDAVCLVRRRRKPHPTISAGRRGSGQDVLKKHIGEETASTSIFAIFFSLCYT